MPIVAQRHELGFADSTREVLDVPNLLAPAPAAKAAVAAKTAR